MRPADTRLSAFVPAATQVFLGSTLWQHGARYARQKGRGLFRGCGRHTVADFAGPYPGGSGKRSLRSLPLVLRMRWAIGNPSKLRRVADACRCHPESIASASSAGVDERQRLSPVYRKTRHEDAGGAPGRGRKNPARPATGDGPSIVVRQEPRARAGTRFSPESLERSALDCRRYS